MTIWFEPIWHPSGPEGVLLGSMEVAAACGAEDAMAAVADGPLAPQLGRSVEGVAIDPLTFDLSISLDGGYNVRTLVADATVDESCHIRKNATGNRLRGSPGGLTVQPPRMEPQ
jgi:hypothetical protein